MNYIKTASSIFDRISKIYDFFLTIFTFGFINKWQRELVIKTPKKDTCLDVGTGTGEIIKKVKEKSPYSLCVGLDLSIEMLKIAEKKLENYQGVLFIKGDIYNAPFKEKTFNSVFLSLTYRHLEHERLMTELSRILKEEGYVSIFDTGRVENEKLWSAFLFFIDKILRPLGYIFFSKEEYNYFVESLRNSTKIENLIERFHPHGYTVVYNRKVFLGIAYIIIFKKHQKT